MLVTGGAGYVGTAVCSALEDRGHEPVVLDIASPGQVRVDVRDGPAVHRAVREFGIESVIHCAALVSSPASFDEPFDYASVNVGGTLSVLDAAIGSGLRSFVFASSAAVYGGGRMTAVSEGASVDPISPYGDSKAVSERHVVQTAEEAGMGACVLRLFNVAGTWNGAYDGPENGHVLPALADAVRYGRPFMMNGSDWPTRDGSCIRDYVHVRDVARAFVLAVEETARGSSLGPVNIGSGIGTSVLELVDAAERISGRRIEVSVGERRRGDPARIVASVSKAERVLGWRPEHSVLEEIMRSVLLAPSLSRRSIRCPSEIPDRLPSPLPRSIPSPRRRSPGRGSSFRAVSRCRGRTPTIREAIRMFQHPPIRRPQG